MKTSKGIESDVYVVRLSRGSQVIVDRFRSLKPRQLIEIDRYDSKVMSYLVPSSMRVSLCLGIQRLTLPSLDL